MRCDSTVPEADIRYATDINLVGDAVRALKTNAPPILIVQGTADTEVPHAQSVELYTKLKAAGDQTQLILVNNMGHVWAQVGPDPIDPPLTQIADDMVSWFERYRAEA